MSYTLSYFPIAARGEPARLIFAAAGVKFVDNRVKFEDWPAMKATMDWGQLPVLQFGDKTLTQSKAIYRYLGRKFKLAGEDQWESARCDMFVDAISDVVDEYVVFAFKEQDPTRKEALMKKFQTETLPTFLGRLNKAQMENGGTWLVGKNMTWADIVVAEFLRQLCDPDPAVLNGYPHVRKMQAAVFANEKIKQYRESPTK